MLYLERPATQQCAVACSRAGRFGYSELKEAAAGQGNAIKKRDDTHKMAQANRAFAHFRF